MEITITAQELAQEKLSHEHLAQAVNAVRMDGYVILSDVIDHEHVDVLRERMDADSQEKIAVQKWGGAGQVVGHLQQGPPPFAPYIFRDIVANPFAIQVTHAILGDGLYNRFYNGNTNCPGSGTQPLHTDGPHLWPDMQIAHPAATLVVNVALMDVSEEDGATELWPGTHLIPSNERRISPESEAKRREIAPPVYAITRKGSLLIRDVRLWHRGVPNRSDKVRHMIAMIHNRSWLQRPGSLLFNTGCEDAFPESPLDHNVEFTDKPLDYLFHRFATIRD
ncbi:phytanoyl-CoA dioxygenase family protein [Chloroflexi bacterium TSY]|nr:phytanoyl-CoA dioxygenase family protein [Chloroflexi bacterium TSY]